MKTPKFIISILISLVLLSCEKEKTEYHKTFYDDYFYGFAGFHRHIIVHENSFSFYDQQENTVFGNLYEYQNGEKPGESIHSFQGFRVPLINKDFFYGVFSVENEDKIVFIELNNFLYKKEIQVTSPRYLTVLHSEYDYVYYNNDNQTLFGNSYGEQVVLVSSGKGTNGKLSVVSPLYNNVVETINTGNEPGKIFVHDYIYVFSNGNNNDSTITKIHYNKNTLSSFQTIKDINVGINPVDYADFTEYETGNNNVQLAILCAGDENTVGSIVIYDVILDKIMSRHTFKNPAIQPEKILSYYQGYVVFYANKKLYEAHITDLENPVIYIDKNIDNLQSVTVFGYHNSYIVGVSKDPQEKSYLYKFDSYSQELVDSIEINGKAKRVI